MRKWSRRLELGAVSYFTKRRNSVAGVKGVIMKTNINNEKCKK